MTIDLNQLHSGLQPHLASLANYHFSYQNPLFWVFLFALFLILTRFWGARKSFLFALVLAAVLLATTAIEQRLASAIVKTGETLDPTIVRIASGVVIMFVILYFVFIKEN